MPGWYYALVALVPVLALYARPRAVGVLIGTVAVTWAIVTFAVGKVDDDDLITFFILVMPVLVVGIAMLVATALAPRPRRWFEAGFFALVGWWFGLMLLLFGAWSSGFGMWDDAMLVALPTVYGASGAAYGATFQV